MFLLGVAMVSGGCLEPEKTPETGDSGDECKDGERGCACTAKETCEEGLVCVDDVCEREAGGGDETTDDDEGVGEDDGGSTTSGAATDDGGTCGAVGCADAGTGTSGVTTTGTSSSGYDTSTTTGVDATDDGSQETSSGPDPSTILFEEDFEGAADNTVPEGWDAFVAWTVNPPANMAGAAEYALADGTKPHGGARSLHVSAPGSNPAMLTRPLPDGTDRVFVRSYVWLTNKLGQNPDNNHETLIGVRGSPGQASVEVRFGEIKGVIGTNEVPSDDISPTMDQWGMGPVITAGEWHCIEVAFMADAAAHEVRAWSDDVEVHVVNDPSQWNNGGLGADFLTGKFEEVILGWHTFSSYGNEVWFDDIVVATERIGC